MSLNEIIVLALAFLTVHFYIEMCMQLLKFVIEDYFKIDNETRGNKAKMCWFLGTLTSIGFLITLIALNVRLPMNIPALALVALIIIDFTACCANLRIWFARLSQKNSHQEGRYITKE